MQRKQGVFPDLIISIGFPSIEYIEQSMSGIFDLYNNHPSSLNIVHNSQTHI